MWKKIAKALFVAKLEPDRPSFSLGSWQEPADSGQAAASANVRSSLRKPEDAAGVSPSLEDNLQFCRQHFFTEQGQGLVIKELLIGRTQVKSSVVYFEGLIDWDLLYASALHPLTEAELAPVTFARLAELLRRVLLWGAVTETGSRGEAADAVLRGSAVLFIEGIERAVVIDAQCFPSRPVGKPNAEMVVRGAQEAFNENLQTNLALLRKRIRSAELITEWSRIGTLSKTDVVLVYVKSIANPKLVNEVRSRLAAIRIDYVSDSGTVEQLIEERPYSMFPNVLSTERPDRVAGQLVEGYVAILVNNSNFALVVPGHLPLFLHTPEDSHLRWSFSTFLRIIRTIGFFMAMFLPSFYVAIANFHQEMLPTPLMIAISSSRELVPIPVATEAFLLEFMFELVREAGIRIPSVIGPTIGIVGALILGQAAVQANIVSPIMVIITAATGLASYSIPNYSLQFSTRILRFMYLFAASMLGFVGITLVFITITVYQVSGNGFGVPWASPYTPLRRKGDATIRMPLEWQMQRSETVRPQSGNKQDGAS